MTLDAAVRRLRIRRLQRKLLTSQRRHRELRAEARLEAAFSESLAAHLVRLQVDAENRGWTTRREVRG